MTKNENENEKVEEVVELKKKKKVETHLKVETTRGFQIVDGWLPQGVYKFTKQEANNLVKKGLGKII